MRIGKSFGAILVGAARGMPEGVDADRTVLLRVFCTFYRDRIVLLCNGYNRRTHPSHSRQRRVYEAASWVFSSELERRIELGVALAAARKARCLTQVALAETAGVQQAEISRIERGAGNATATTLLRLAEALGQKVILVPAET